MALIPQQQRLLDNNAVLTASLTEYNPDHENHLTKSQHTLLIVFPPCEHYHLRYGICYEKGGHVTKCTLSYKMGSHYLAVNNQASALTTPGQRSCLQLRATLPAESILSLYDIKIKDN